LVAVGRGCASRPAVAVEITAPGVAVAAGRAVRVAVAAGRAVRVAVAAGRAVGVAVAGGLRVVAEAATERADALPAASMATTV
jgi:hypothetical protein